MPINYFNEELEFKLKNKLKIKSWVKRTIEEEGNKFGTINYIFCTDDYLLKVNQEYLNHDYYTDIITFDTSDKEGIISSDIFISIDRVLDNSENSDFDSELRRVMIHGVLHLCGYDDHSDSDIKIMREKEKYYLEKF